MTIHDLHLVARAVLEFDRMNFELQESAVDLLNDFVGGDLTPDEEYSTAALLVDMLYPIGKVRLEVTK